MTQSNQNTPALKPGNQSTEYTGKVTAQTILGLIALANIILEYLGRPSVLLDAETAALIAIGLEAIWGVARQTNKAVEIHTQGAVRIAELQAISTNMTEVNVVDPEAIRKNFPTTPPDLSNLPK
jgi:hypothetical protein